MIATFDSNPICYKIISARTPEGSLRSDSCVIIIWVVTFHDYFFPIIVRFALMTFDFGSKRWIQQLNTIVPIGVDRIGDRAQCIPQAR